MSVLTHTEPYAQNDLGHPAACPHLRLASALYAELLEAYRDERERKLAEDLAMKRLSAEQYGLQYSELYCQCKRLQARFDAALAGGEEGDKEAGSYAAKGASAPP